MKVMIFIKVDMISNYKFKKIKLKNLELFKEKNFDKDDNRKREIGF